MVRQGQAGKAAKRERDEHSTRQPAWREQAPARPRKRVKRRQSTAPGMLPKASGRGRARAPVVTLPSRETVLAALRAAALIVSGIAVTAGLIYLLRWPELAVSRTSTLIGGYERIAPEVIYAGSGVDGRNILLLRASDVADEVKKVPGVARADVHVRLPNQVIIDIEEHAPLVAWQTITNTIWLAADGAEVPQAGAAPPISFTDRSTGGVDNDPALRKLILENLAAVHAARPAITEFSYADEPGLHYRAPEGWDVWLGESGPMNDKLALAEATGQDIARQGARAKVVDVRQSERKAMWW